MTPSFVPGIILRCDSGKNQLNFAVWCATTGCGVSYEDHLSGDIPGFAKSMFIFHVYYQIRRIIFELEAPLPTAQSWNAFDNSFDEKSMKKSAQNSTLTKTSTGARSLMKMVALVLFSIISPAHGISHSRAFHMMLTKCRSPNTTKESFISTTSLSSIARGQRSYLISQTVLQDQALSVSINQSAQIAGQSLVLNLRLNQISSGLAAHLMRRNNFLLILKMQSKALWICPARLLDTRMDSNMHAPRWIMYLGLVCTWLPVIWNCG